MSIQQLFEISRRSFRSASAAINTAGQNIANAETPGYTRRRVTLGADSISGSGLLNAWPPTVARGMGVSVNAYERVRDMLLTEASWEAQAGLGSSEEEYRILSAVEGLFPTGSTGTLHEALSNFWNSWSDLADHPTDEGVRFTIRNRADTLAHLLNGLDHDLRRMTEETEQELRSGVDTINRLIEKIATLNKAVRTGQSAGTADLAAADERDLVVRELAAFVPLRVQTDARGNYNLAIGGIQVLEGDAASTLSVDTSGATPQVRFSGTSATFRAGAEGDGKLGAWLRTLGQTLPGTINALNTFTETFVTEVNALHRTGYGLDGGTGRDVFDPAQLTAGTIQLSDAVRADASVIAASGSAGTQGDSTTALNMAALRTEKLFNGGAETAEGFLINLVSSIGAKVEQASSRSVSQSAVAQHLDSIERGASGVSMDEELTDLIRYQQSYAAAARVLTTAQTLVDTLLAM